MSFRPPLRMGSNGPAVEAVQRLFWRAAKAEGRVATNKRNGQYGTRTIHDARDFQLHHRIQASGNTGAHTWAALERHQDDLTRALLARALADSQEETRAELIARRLNGIIAAAEYQIANWARYRYEQARPILDYGYLPPSDPHLFKRQDCSESVISQAYAVGAPDPSGGRYNGSGNTWALRSAGTPVDGFAASRPGDLLHYNGSGGSQHVARLLNVGAFSFGSTPPRRRDPHYRTIVLITRHPLV